MRTSDSLGTPAYRQVLTPARCANAPKGWARRISVGIGSVGHVRRERPSRRRPRTPQSSGTAQNVAKPGSVLPFVLTRKFNEVIEGVLEGALQNSHHRS